MKTLRHRGISKFAHSYTRSKCGRQLRLQDTGSAALLCSAALAKASTFHSCADGRHRVHSTAVTEGHKLAGLQQWKLNLSRVREAPSPRSRCWQGDAPSKTSRGGSSLPSCSFQSPQVSLGLWQDLSNLCVCVHAAVFPLCAFVSLLFLGGQQSRWIRAHPNDFILITSARPYF